jgi:hypothetical protein
MALPAAILDNRIHELRLHYELEDAEPIETFLAERPPLLEILTEAPQRVAAAFRCLLPLRLELYRDFDAPDVSQLHLVVVTGMKTEAEWDAADASIRCLHEDWLRSLPRSVTRDLFVVAEPR